MLWRVYQGVNSLGNLVVLCSVWGGITRLFAKWPHYFILPPEGRKCPSPQPQQNVLLPFHLVFIMAFVVYARWCLLVGLTSPCWLVTFNIFSCASGPFVYLCGEMSIQIFVHLWLGWSFSCWVIRASYTFWQHVEMCSLEMLSSIPLDYLFMSLEIISL